MLNILENFFICNNFFLGPMIYPVIPILLGGFTRQLNSLKIQRSFTNAAYGVFGAEIAVKMIVIASATDIIV